MEVCAELENLANEFETKGYKLYIVGGYVRDQLLGISNNDIDITSNMSCDEVLNICKKLKIKTYHINKTLGTIQLKYNDKKFEYTRFRQESYDKIGAHCPSEICFVDDIKVDALRRDFSINSIYYNITDKIIEDYVGGQKDLTNHILRTANAPDITLQDDGLRILRAVRFASTLNFQFHKKTYKALKKYTANLNKISKERILNEIRQLVVADIKHNIPNKNFLEYCNKFKLPKYIFNSMLSNLTKFNKKDIEKFYLLSQETRLIGFYLLILTKYFKYYTNSNLLGYSINTLLGINGIKESNDNIRLTEKLYRIIQNLNYFQDNLNATINYLTLSDYERELVQCFINAKAKDILSVNISTIKCNNLPLSANELPITPDDLINLGIERKYISKIMTTLYNQVLNMQVKNTNEDLKNLAKQINETFKEITTTKE